MEKAQGKTGERVVISKRFRFSNDHKYQTSKDYKRLFSLIQETSVICIVDYGSCCRDIASTLFINGVAEIAARGICYLWAEGEDDFIEQCEVINLEFLEPLPQ